MMEGFREIMPPGKTTKHSKIEEFCLYKMAREGKIPAVKKEKEHKGIRAKHILDAAYIPINWSNIRNSDMEELDEISTSPLKEVFR